MVELFSVAGMIGVMIVGAAVFGYVYSVILGHPIEDIPNWLSMAVGTVVGFFYGRREADKAIAEAKTAQAIAEAVTNKLPTPPE